MYTRNVHFRCHTWVIFTMGYCNFAVTQIILGEYMYISAMLSVLKVSEEVMKLLNDIEVHTYV